MTQQQVTPYPTGTATGPHDAAFLPRPELSARPADRPITESVPGLGGEPRRPTGPPGHCLPSGTGR